MLSVEDFLLIILAVLVGNIILQKLFYRTIMYPFHRFRIYILYRMFIFKYRRFYRNIPLNSNNKNILFLCHGRHHGVPLTISGPAYNYPPNYNFGVKQPLLLNQIDIRQYNSYTIDRDSNMNPHLIFDVLDPFFFRGFEDEMFDYVVLFNCNCHTKEINDSSTVLTNIKRILKPDGELLLKLANKARIDEAGFTRYSQYSFLYNRGEGYKTYKEYIDPQIGYTVTPVEIYTGSFKKCEPISEEKVSINIITVLSDNTAVQPLEISNNNNIIRMLNEIIGLSQGVQGLLNGVSL